MMGHAQSLSQRQAASTARQRSFPTEHFHTREETNEKFLDDMDRELLGWGDPVARLHAALDGDELALYCQPIRALNGTAGAQPYPMAEVLVRMRSEEKSLLPPGEFLPVFEHYRM